MTSSDVTLACYSFFFNPEDISMKQKLFSLQYKIWIVTILITVIPLTALGLVSNRVSLTVLKEHVGQSNFKTNQQIADKIDMVFSRLDEYSLNLWRDETFIRCLKNTENMRENIEAYRLTAQKVINSYQVFEENIYSAYIEADNGLVYDTASVKNTISDSLREELVRRNGKGILIADEVIDFSGNKQKVFSYLRVLKNPDVLSEKLAIIKINIKEETIEKIYQGMQLSASSQIYVVEANNRILSSKNKEEMGETLPADLFAGASKQEQSGFFEYAKGREVVTYVALQGADWKLVNIISTSELNQGAETITRMTVGSIVISLILCFFISLYVSYRISKPIRVLQESMKLIDEEHFDIVIPVEGNDEIALLGNSFNKMLVKLKKLIQEVYVMQIKQREAEIAVLQEQINPHFLYNTLNTIYWMCRTENANQSAKIVRELSNLFRLSLNSGELITSVKKEIEHLNCYIAIQEKRFEGLVTFEVQVEEEILNSNTIKLVLQPLVENALIHGIEKKGEHGIIRILGYKKGNTLYFVVEDNGVGGDEAEINKILKESEEKNRGFAIHNVNARIKIRFGEEYGLFYQSEKGKGTKAVVKQLFSTKE